MNSEYNERVFSNEENLFNSLSVTYPVQLDKYFDIFANTNYYNLCNFIQWIA